MSRPQAITSAPALPAMRPAAGWLLLHAREDEIDVLETAIDPSEEVWLMLHQFAEVADRGQAHIRTLQPGLTPTEVENAWREFRAFVRQAEAFYRGALPLHWKSSPLNYYYSFLNLAKAILVAHGLLPSGKVRHGLSSVVPALRSGISDWKVCVRVGVFPKLYEFLFNQPLAEGSELQIGQVLAYSMPVAFQYTQAGLGDPRISAGRCTYLRDAAQSWILIAVQRRLDISAHPVLGPRLLSVFREIEAPKEFALKVFNFHAVASEQHQFWESINVTPLGPSGDVLTVDALAPLYQGLPGAVSPTVSHHDDVEFVLSLPYDTGAAGFLPMSELVASYAAIFFLSELVRYYPERLDYIAETHDGWLIESFVRSFPTQMLRLMLNAILGRTIVLKKH